MGDQGTHHTSLDTEESLSPLSIEDTEEQSTIPSSEDIVEVGASQQVNRVKSHSRLRKQNHTNGEGKGFRKTTGFQETGAVV